MGFYNNVHQFNNKEVEDFDPETGITTTEAAYRFYTDYEETHDVPKNLKQFIADDKVSQIDNLVFGMWGEHDSTPDKLIDILIENKDKLQHLKGVFFGDIAQEENEISWIQNTSYEAFFKAFPNLEVFQVRGGCDLALGVLNLKHLKRLVIETGGMLDSIVKDLAASEFPALEHLELWLGADEYGFDSSAQQVKAVYSSPTGNKFPKLKYLGLRNSEIADELAAGLMNDEILNHIEVLDLSNGTLSDEGAEALFDNPAIKNLKKLILDHHYISDEMCEQLKELGIPVSLDDQQDDDTYDDEVYRYVAVSE